MTLTQRDKVNLRARAARDAAIVAVDNMVLDKTDRDIIRHHVDELYSAYSLLSTMGEEPVLLTLQTQLKEETEVSVEVDLEALRALALRARAKTVEPSMYYDVLVPGNVLLALIEKVEACK